MATELHMGFVIQCETCLKDMPIRMMVYQTPDYSFALNGPAKCKCCGRRYTEHEVHKMRCDDPRPSVEFDCECCGKGNYFEIEHEHNDYEPDPTVQCLHCKQTLVVLRPADVADDRLAH